MVGTFSQTGVAILRRATAAGLSGLAFALFVGVMAFALTTSPAGHSEESASRFLAASNRVLESGSISAIPLALRQQSSRVTVVPVNEQALLVSRPDDPADERAVSGGGDGAQATALALSAPGVAGSVADRTVTASALRPPELAASADTEPDLGPGERAQATISFYYCEPGALGLHPGDGGGFCGVMRDGTVVYPGAAACAYVYLGQQFRIVGDPLERIYRCADTGSAVHGLHRDIWFMTSDEGWAWQLAVGQTATIEILP